MTEDMSRAKAKVIAVHQMWVEGESGAIYEPLFNEDGVRMKWEKVADNWIDAASRLSTEPEVEQQECPSCGGQGQIGDYVGLEMRCIGVECDGCKGTGRFPADPKAEQVEERTEYEGIISQREFTKKQQLLKEAEGGGVEQTLSIPVENIRFVSEEYRQRLAKNGIQLKGFEPKEAAPEAALECSRCRKPIYEVCGTYYRHTHDDSTVCGYANDWPYIQPYAKPEPATEGAPETAPGIEKFPATETTRPYEEATCRHCGDPIWRITDEYGTGWMHRAMPSNPCKPKPRTNAEPAEPKLEGASIQVDMPSYAIGFKACQELTKTQPHLFTQQAEGAEKAAKCGKVAASMIPRLGMYRACVLDKDHEGRCKPGGSCNAHGEYVGDHCPHWPDCIQVPSDIPKDPVSQNMYLDLYLKNETKQAAYKSVTELAAENPNLGEFIAALESRNAEPTNEAERYLSQAHAAEGRDVVAHRRAEKAEVELAQIKQRETPESAWSRGWVEGLTAARGRGFPIMRAYTGPKHPEPCVPPYQPMEAK